MIRRGPLLAGRSAARAAAEPEAVAVPDGGVVRTCRNCGVAAPGAYCPACGQETKLALPTLREFMREAAGRYVAVDGRLGKTVGALLFRPGFLTREYLAGRRRRYIRPARLFLVASLLLFAVLRIEVEFGGVDIVKFDEAAAPANAGKAGATAEPGAKGKTAEAGQIDDRQDIELGGVEDAIPGLRERIANFNRLSSRERIGQLTDGMLRYGPYAMFLLLPAFAALLKIVYLGRRRRYPNRPRLYGEHFVFAAHIHTFLFLVAIVAMAIPVSSLRMLLAAWALIYMLWSLHAVYRGSWIGIAARSFTLYIAYMVLFGIVTAGLVVAAVLLR